MRKYYQFTADEILPDRQVILAAQGIPQGAEVSERTGGLVDQARGLFLDKAEPVGLMETISPAEFGEVFIGEGKNDPETPVLDIYPKAAHLALFTATLGGEICAEIDARFDSSDYAVGSMLDSFASAGAENIGPLLSKMISGELQSMDGSGGAPTTLAYSPGYCGWNVSGQIKLFAHLRPVETGVELKQNGHLMVPLKSISGVLISGERETHFFDNNYVSCELCRDKTCLVRQRNLRKENRNRGLDDEGREEPTPAGGM